MKRHEGDIYYTKEFNSFFQVRKIHDDYWICGDFQPYFDDAATTLGQQQLSYEFISNSILITAIDKCEYAYPNNGYWRVRINDN